MEEQSQCVLVFSCVLYVVLTGYFGNLEKNNLKKNKMGNLYEVISDHFTFQLECVFVSVFFCFFYMQVMFR